ncbi:hypothetical protein B0T25DRAFT_266682 [Lasiosphaeria hispida]|uniref:Uncharacterized protein n=1 Tax=Lasiosphaeria hispida TaxID=260671 RepID=A0AAJ0HAY5_9PEZI|nr:hypothetical protein B0T25DRAFT_266682 [Lasiosphaeria hispida]
MASYEYSYGDDEAIDARRVMGRDRTPGRPTRAPYYLRTAVRDRVDRYHYFTVDRPTTVIQERYRGGRDLGRERYRSLGQVAEAQHRLEYLRARNGREDSIRQAADKVDKLLSEDRAIRDRLDRQFELRELRRQKRAEEEAQERIWELRYDISTWKRHNHRRYRLINLQTEHRENSRDHQWRGVPHDIFDVHRGRDLTFQMEFPIHLIMAMQSSIFRV